MKKTKLQREKQASIPWVTQGNSEFIRKCKLNPPEGDKFRSRTEEQKKEVGGEPNRKESNSKRVDKKRKSQKRRSQSHTGLANHSCTGTRRGGKYPRTSRQWSETPKHNIPGSSPEGPERRKKGIREDSSEKVNFKSNGGGEDKGGENSKKKEVTPETTMIMVDVGKKGNLVSA